jgi:hypothetical protein
MIDGCSDLGVMVFARQIGRISAVATLMVCAGMLVSKARTRRLLTLAFVWLMATMLATGAIPVLVCRGRAQLTAGAVFEFGAFIAAVLLACFLTFRLVGRRRVAQV